MVIARLRAVGKALLLLVVAVVLQTVLISHVSVLGVTADLFLILTVAVAMARGPLYGAVFGFIAGLGADIAFLEPLGMRSLILVLVGYAVGAVGERLGVLSPWAVFLLAGGSSFVGQFFYALFQFVIGPRAGFFTVVGIQMFPGALLDGLVTLPVYWLLIRLRVLSTPHAESKGTSGGGGE